MSNIISLTERRIKKAVLDCWNGKPIDEKKLYKDVKENSKYWYNPENQRYELFKP